MQRMRTLCFLLFFIILRLTLSAQILSVNNEPVFGSKKEAFISISSELAFQNITELTRFVSIDRINDNKIYAYINRKGLNYLNSKGIPFEMEPHPGKSDKKPKMYHGSLKEINLWDAYPTYDAYVDMMYQFQTDHPNLCQIIETGTTVQGRKQIFAKISDNVSVYEQEPRFMYSSSMHGDEVTGYVLMLRLINHLLSEYSVNTEIQQLVDGMEIWICPLENPDGTYAGGNQTVNGATRFNANGIDLNRNYPNPLYGDHPDGEVWQPEILSFIHLTDSIHFVMSANFHGGAEVLNYPWDTWTSNVNSHADDNWWIDITTAYANSAISLSPSGYLQSVTSSGISNGGDWYVVYGTRQDYNTYFKHMRELTIEISNTKLLPSDQLPAHWDYNHIALLNYMKEATYGIRGMVTDSITGEPLLAKIEIAGHDKDNSHVFTELPSGLYFRPLESGTWELTYSADGYRSKLVNLLCSDGSYITQDVQLVNLNQVAPIADFTASPPEVQCNMSIEFINTSSASENTTYLWDFGDGTTSSEQNPTHQFPGFGKYTIKLIAENSIGIDSITKADFVFINLAEGPVAHHGSACSPDTAVFLEVTGNGDILWYSDSVGGSPIASGNSFTTTGLLNSETYYAESHFNSSSQYVGMTNNSTGGAYYTFNVSQYLTFNCYKSIILKSVKVYADAAGVRSIFLQDSNGQNIDSTEIFLNAGEQRVTLDFQLPVSNDLRLTAGPAPGLFRSKNNWSNLPYPFTISDTIAITNNSSNDLRYYYFFYDWEISAGECISQRTPVHAWINEIAAASFNYTTSGLTVDIINTSSYATDHFWDFGDGSTSQEESPLHVYQTAGAYQIMLIASTNCSADTTISEIIISSISEHDIYHKTLVSPNPADDFITLKTRKDDDIIIEIIDSQGRQYYRQNSTYRETSIKTDQLESGFYLLMITYNSGEREVHRLAIRH